MRAPSPRGPLSERVLHALTTGDVDAALPEQAARTAAASADLLVDEDVQITLTALYELHYQGLDGVDDRLEWDPTLLRVRAALEDRFEAQLRRDVAVPEDLLVELEANTEREGLGPAVARALFDMTSRDDGPSLSAYVARKATDAQLREMLIQRSVYQLKEADPHTWAVPRLLGVPKAALVEIQADEYGGGRPERMHAALFARTMRGLGLDDTYGRYVDDVPAITLASVNMMSLFGLHRRLRGCIVGHLAAFEMTSSQPNRLYGNGFRRHGYDADVTWYFDEHVEADAVHEQIAGRDLAGGLVEQQPALRDDVLFGAAACLAVDGRVGRHQIERWTAGESSLRRPLAVGSAA
ncbi:iron-containing redox enzyme family protein [Cellulomonas sp. IC4_254]|uniref:iron-containing redox enzyme family protein n=1 Tax=Cellulomonas sp. IC4_254 TaxID=2714040 RepID=UPI0014246A99|nr:iron-containing redox enzyme family protein [Cellulomonas sp. IC4_254]NHT18250.1 iron-containing redox enzyme family protein [Cellulomonas sp. IC4_254]